MKHRKILWIGIISLVTIANQNVFGQSHCYIENEGNPSNVIFSSSVCDEESNYSPADAGQTPLITVRLAFHIFQKDDGTGNFENNPTDLAILNNFEGEINNRLSNLAVLNMGTSNYIQDSRIRVAVEGIYFYPYTEDWDFPLSKADTIYNDYIINDYGNHGFTEDQKYNVEHILFTGESGVLGGAASGIGSQGFVFERGIKENYLVNGFHYVIGNIVHELFHSFGLQHNFHTEYRDQCDKCYDNDPVELDCPIQATSNNYMDYWPEGYASWYPGLSECQLSKARFYLMGGLGTISRTVLKDYCSYNANETIEINSTTTWNSHKRLRGNLIINPGATLTIKCKVHFSDNSKVFIKQGAKLIIDGGILTNECNDYWHGVQVYGDFYQHQYPAHNPTYQGLLVLQNGGTIEYAHDGARNWKNNSWWERGGVIQSNDGVFRNNQINPSSFNKIPHITMFFKT